MMTPTAIFAAIRPLFGLIALYSQQIAMGFVLLFGTFGALHVFRREYGAAIRCGFFVFMILSLFFGGLSFSFMKKTGGLFTSTPAIEETVAVHEASRRQAVGPIDGSAGIYTGRGSFSSGEGGVYSGGGGSSGDTLSSGLMKLLKKF